MIHPSNVRCDDCGERHTPGNPTECIEQLRDQMSGLREALETIATINNANTLNDYGGGNVAWWHDYIRAEVGRLEEIARDALA